MIERCCKCGGSVHSYGPHPEQLPYCGYNQTCPKKIEEDKYGIFTTRFVNEVNIDLGYVDIDDLPNYDGDSKNVAKALNYAIAGLLTDGGHHKQWTLERIIESLGIDLDLLRKTLETPDSNGDYYSWDKGCPP